MSERWAVKLDPRSAESCAPLRCLAGVEVCEQDEALWVRGRSEDPAVQRAMWLLPGEHFRINEKSQLVPWSHLLPIGPAPEGPWRPLSEYIQPRANFAALPGVVSSQVELRLVRSSIEQPAAMLLTSLSAWSAYGQTAPAIRLSRLEFAASDSGQVVVRGHPLPALPGVRYTLADGVAIPSGYAWTLNVGSATVSRLLNLQRGQVALFSPDGAYEMIPAEAWAAATRSAIRMTAQEIAP